jgi:hypothetical protein
MTSLASVLTSLPVLAVHERAVRLLDVVVVRVRQEADRREARATGTEVLITLNPADPRAGNDLPGVDVEQIGILLAKG